MVDNSALSTAAASLRPRLSRLRGSMVPFRAYLLMVVVLGGVSAAFANAVGLAASAVLGLSAPTAVFFGWRINRPSRGSAWPVLTAAIFVGTLGAALRGGGGDAGSSLFVNLCAVSFYLLFGAALVKMIRARSDGPGFPGAVLDGVLITTALLLVSWIAFVVPVLGALSVQVVFLAIFPVLSGVILFLGTQLSLTKVLRLTAFRLIGFGISCVLVADLVCAANAAGYTAVDPLLTDMLYLFAATMAGLAALHPSMVHLTEPAPLAVERFSRSRSVTLGVSLAIPCVIILFFNPNSLVERVPIAVGGLVLVALVTSRVVEAVRHYASSQDTLLYAATHDSLTNLPNRAFLLDELDGLFSSGDHAGLAVLFCDLDRFKYVNDTWGHSVGDKLLVQVGERIAAVTSGSAATVARIGGDEFVVLFRGVLNSDAAVVLGDLVLSAFNDPFFLDVGNYHIAPSVGVAFCAAHEDVFVAEGTGSGSSGGDMVRQADIAMYCAKAAGGGVSLFDAEMQVAAARRLCLENELRGAGDRGELVVHYQPVVEASSGVVSSFEALVRWNHPVRGMVPPLEFIPISEETGTIVEIGSFVTSSVVGTLSRWWAEDPDSCPVVAVNVSGRQMRDSGFAEWVAGLLAAGGVPAHRLCVEVTESMVLDGSPEIANQIKLLSDMGVVIAADDFGTGYSSLGYLKDYPIDRVKIDKSFIDGLSSEGGVRADDVAIVDAVLAMADALDLDVVAEGVESADQRDHLVERGCRWIQGWFFGKAVPVEEADLLVGAVLPRVVSSVG